MRSMVEGARIDVREPRTGIAGRSVQMSSHGVALVSLPSPPPRLRRSPPPQRCVAEDAGEDKESASPS